MIGSATFSNDKKYRYHLMREWDHKKDKVCFLMLNPSDAGAVESDPTITRCIGFAKDWGYGGLEVVNLFSLVSSDPAALYDSKNPIGDHNDRYILETANRCAEVIVAWGNIGEFNDRANQVLEFKFNKKFKCLKQNKSGSPGHPLYLSKNSKRILF